MQEKKDPRSSSLQKAQNAKNAVIPAGDRGLTRRRFLALSAAGFGLAAVRFAGVPGGFSWAQGEMPTPIVGGSLDYALVGVDDRFDPAATTWTTVSTILNHITEPLVAEMEPGVFSPNLAESVTVSDDATVFTFKLRQGVSFTDGTPFNAEAVKFTFDRIVDPAFIAGLARADLGPYERTDVVDDYTARVVMSRPYAPFLTYVASSYLGIVSPTAVRELGDEGFLFNPVGTGPLMWKDYVANSHITLVRNPNYVGARGFFNNLGPSYLDEVVIRIVPSATVRVGALRSGEVQFIEAVDPLALPSVRADQNLEVLQKEQNGIPYAVLFNMVDRTDTGRLAKTAELAVRKAFSFAIDRENIVQTLMGETGSSAWNFLPPLNWAYDEAAASMYSYDPARAMSLLEEAGWQVGADGIRTRDGERLTCDFNFTQRPFDAARSEMMQADLAVVGIEARLFGRETAASRAAVLARNYEVTSTWTVRSDPDCLSLVSHTNGVFNRSHYSNPQVDAWLDEAVGLSNQAERKELYAMVQRQIMEDCIGLPYAFGVLTHGHRKEVREVDVDSRGACTWLRDTWLDV